MDLSKTFPDRPEHETCAVDRLALDTGTADYALRSADTHGRLYAASTLYSALWSLTYSARTIARVAKDPNWHAEHLIGVHCKGLTDKHVEHLVLQLVHALPSDRKRKLATYLENIA